jgi:glycine betaine/proline transport system ATP-binding protein
MQWHHKAAKAFDQLLDNVALPLELRGEPESTRRAAAQRQLQAVGLKAWGERLPHELSGGMQQRVGLARATTHRWVIWLLPMAGFAAGLVYHLIGKPVNSAITY